MRTITNYLTTYHKYHSEELLIHNKLLEFSNIIWLGSGLAKISASYANDISQENGIISRFNSLLHYKNIPNGIPILISLGGKGSDAIDIAHRMSSLHKKGFITCNKNSIIYQIASNATYFSNPFFPEIDKGFVNANGIIALSYLSEIFALKHMNKKNQRKKLNIIKIEKNINTLFNKIVKLQYWNNNIIVLGIGYNSSIQHSWEAILQESAIAQITWKDIKDYTHGDHLFAALHTNKIFILLENKETKEYCDIFEERFSKICQVHRIPLSSNITNAFWENLFYILSLTEKLSHHIGFEGKRPPKNELVHSWREWGRL